MNEYLIHFSKSEKYKNDKKDRNYLLLNGFATLTHVFNITLKQYNSSIALAQAIANTEKSIYYYTQFIEQMEANVMYDLNVSSNSASLFVYKKTIHELQLNFKKNMTLQNVDDLIIIYRLIVECLLRNNYNSTIPDNLINIAMEICRNNHNELTFRQEITNTMLFVNHFAAYMTLKQNVYDYIFLYVKKYKQKHLSLSMILKKKIHPDYDNTLLNKSANDYIKWLLH